MANHKKTREQKIAASLKREQNRLSYSLTDLPVVSHPTNTLIKSAAVGNYAYVVSDVRKTFSISFFLVALQYVLFFLLQHHVLKIPGVSY